MARSLRVAFATSSALPDSTEDDRSAIRELAGRGVQAVPTVWDDPSASWSDFSAVIIRSTWDYCRDRERFLQWVDRVGKETVVWNPAELVRWNSHKSYLVDLAADGVDVVPTELVRRGDERTLSSITLGRGWSDVVVKPAVGANARGLRVIRRDEGVAGEEHLRSLLAAGDALVQPLLDQARSRGERSVILFEGVFSHGVDYPFVLQRESRSGKPAAIDATAREEIRKVVASLPLRPLYARVDFLPIEDDRWLLSELELIEPDLFLQSSPNAPQRFADAIVERLNRYG
ncbi:MAG: hypothetical protein WBW47_05920 [Thermoplasmata archaeon]